MQAGHFWCKLGHKGKDDDMNANELSNTMGEASEAVNRSAEAARHKFADVSNAVMDRSKAAAVRTDTYVHEYAWTSIALAALLGVAIGLMIRR
jgi:ElaB/YqjD/DUF883 family membrane-anchored ribosome-binding protein